MIFLICIFPLFCYSQKGDTLTITTPPSSISEYNLTWTFTDDLISVSNTDCMAALQVEKVRVELDNQDSKITAYTTALGAYKVVYDKKEEEYYCIFPPYIEDLYIIE